MLGCKVLVKCLLAASLQNQVPPEALLAIMEVEGGRSGLEVKNANGSFDMGLMQINSCWLPEVAQKWNITQKKARTLLKEDDCFNLWVAAFILKTKIREGGGNLLQGIVRYNNANPEYGHPYRDKVIHAYHRQEQKRRKHGAVS